MVICLGSMYVCARKDAKNYTRGETVEQGQERRLHPQDIWLARKLDTRAICTTKYGHEEFACMRARERQCEDMDKNCSNTSVETHTWFSMTWVKL